MKARSRLIEKFGMAAPNGAKRKLFFSQEGWDSTTERHRVPFSYNRRFGKELNWVNSPYNFNREYQRNDAVFVCDEGQWAPSVFRYTDSIISASNQAYAKAVSAMRDNADASIGAFIAEGGEALTMLYKRGKQMRSAYKHLRRFRLKEMFEVLGYQGRIHNVERPGFRRNMKLTSAQASGVFLEVSYGWLPAIGDMVDACEVLASSPEFAPCKGSSKHNTTYREEDPFGNYSYRWDWSGKVKVGWLSAISNPNLVLLNQLGLINPVAVGWEVVPFTFLVDQVLNVQQFLESWTDFLGFNTSGHYRVVATNASFVRSVTGGVSGLATQTMTGHVYKRILGAYRPQLIFTGALGLASTVRRVANNTALLVSLLTGRKAS